jgi:hypothetical protein
MVERRVANLSVLRLLARLELGNSGAETFPRRRLSLALATPQGRRDEGNEGEEDQRQEEVLHGRKARVRAP